MTLQATLNERDFESPGYEYLRSCHSMSELYYKLVALNYRKDFCSLYKCPPIHRYYFSSPSKNPSEQQFMFTCLCAWLIKDKCQMNLELEPEEYEDPSVYTGLILEAVKLLLVSDDEPSDIKISFSCGRLKNGYGPEVIWTMSILADRAIELMLQNGSKVRKPNILYHNQDGNRQTGNGSIMIGQPFVGGGLTTRPLGSYQIDDKTLLFDDDTKPTMKPSSGVPKIEINPIEWYDKVERFSQALKAIDNNSDKRVQAEKWKDYITTISSSKSAGEEFLAKSKPLLDVITTRIDRHLHVLHSREKFIQSKLENKIEDFRKIWRNYTAEIHNQKILLEKVNSKTGIFESHRENIKQVNLQIEARIKELNDESKLKDLDSMIKQLSLENAEFDVNIGLLLVLYSKKQAKIHSTT